MKVRGPFTLEEAKNLCDRYAFLVGIEGYRKDIFRRTVSWVLPAPYEGNELSAYVNYAYFPDPHADAKMKEALQKFSANEYDVLVYMDYDEDVDEYLFEYYRLNEFLLRHRERLLPGDTLSEPI